MRVEQIESSFNPVTITLDSQSEVDTFKEMLTIAYNNSASDSSTERLADDLRDKMTDGGWQSSDMNC